MIKKFFSFSAVVILTTICVHAQLSFGVQAGLTGTDMSIIHDGEYSFSTMKTEMILGYQVGVVMDLKNKDLLGMSGFQTGLFVMSQGYEFRNEKVNSTYIQAPMDFRFHLGSKKITFLQIGWYFSFPVSGIVTYDINGTKEIRDIKFGKDDDAYLKSFDSGFRIGGGWDFDIVQIVLNVNSGIRDLSKKKNIEMTNMSMSASIVYLFGW